MRTFDRRAPTDRFVQTRNRNNPKRSGKTMKLPVWLMPAFLTFGPFFIAISMIGTRLNVLVPTIIGAVMLSSGLATLFIKVMELEKEINEMKSGGKEPD
jgi:hypothetical protein